MELKQTSQLALQIGVKQEALQYLTPVQQGWLQLAKNKVDLFDQLTKDNLAVQNELKDIDKFAIVSVDATIETLNDNWKKVTAIISKAKEVADTSQQMRLNFTNTIKQGVIDPAMDFEKKNQLLIDEANKKEFNLRQMVVKKQNEGAALQKEKEQLEAHIKNEYFRIAAKYRMDLTNMIEQAYQTALRGKTPIDQIESYKENIIKFMNEVKLDLFVRFNRILVDDKTAGEIFAGIKPYDGKNDLITHINQLQNKFAMYGEDFKNAEAAILKSNESLQQTIQQENQQLTIDQGTTALMTSATSLVMSGGATIKVSVKVVEENSDTWALKIIESFVKNWGNCRKFISVKEWGNLKLSQMAVALGKYATESGRAIDDKGNVISMYDGLTLIKSEK